MATAVTADGSPMIDLGRATLDFTLSNVPFRHSFMVVSGKPLLILGNDFLRSEHVSSIHLSKASGHIVLRQADSEAPPQQSPLSMKPPPAEPVAGVVAFASANPGVTPPTPVNREISASDSPSAPRPPNEMISVFARLTGVSFMSLAQKV